MAPEPWNSPGDYKEKNRPTVRVSVAEHEFPRNKATRCWEDEEEIND